MGQIGTGEDAQGRQLLEGECPVICPGATCVDSLKALKVISDVTTSVTEAQNPQGLHPLRRDFYSKGHTCVRSIAGHTSRPGPIRKRGDVRWIPVLAHARSGQGWSGPAAPDDNDCPGVPDLWTWAACVVRILL